MTGLRRTRLWLLAGIIAVLSGCAATGDQPGFCAFGEAPDGGRLERVSEIKAGRYQDENGIFVDGGPEDFAVLNIGAAHDGNGVKTGQRWRLFISAVKRPGKSNIGEIRTAVFNTGTKTFEEGSLDTIPLDGFDDDLHPVGLSLHKVKGEKAHLYVINKRYRKWGEKEKVHHRIETFLFDAEKTNLVYQGPLESSKLADPNDLLVTDDDIYVSNPKPVYAPLLGAWAYADWPSLARHRSDKEAQTEGVEVEFQRVDHQFGFANGIVEPRQDRLIVADFSGGVLAVFDRDETTGDLAHLFDIDLGDAGYPDNLMLADDKKTLYIATHKSLFYSSVHLLSPIDYAPSAVYAVDLTDAVLQPGREAPKLVLDDHGVYLKAASTALEIDDVMIVSQLKNPEIYAFTCQPLSAAATATAARP